MQNVNKVKEISTFNIHRVHEKTVPLYTLP